MRRPNDYMAQNSERGKTPDVGKMHRLRLPRNTLNADSHKMTPIFKNKRGSQVDFNTIADSFCTVRKYFDYSQPAESSKQVFQVPTLPLLEFEQALKPRKENLFKDNPDSIFTLRKLNP